MIAIRLGRLLASVVILAGMATLDACQTKPPPRTAQVTAWRIFTDYAGGFTVLMPPRPMTSVDRVPGVTSNSTVEIHNFVADPNPSLELAVIYNDFPESAGDLGSVGYRRFFNAIQNEGLKKLGAGRLVSSWDATFEGYPVREFAAELTSKNCLSRSRVILVGHRMYQLIAVWGHGEDPSGDVDKFFNSFHLLLGKAQKSLQQAQKIL